MMKKGGGGIGLRKHRTSGHPGKSPKLRLHERMEAEKDEKKRKKVKMFNSVREALEEADVNSCYDFGRVERREH